MRPGPCLRLADPASASNLTFGTPGLPQRSARRAIDNAEPEIPDRRTRLTLSFRDCSRSGDQLSALPEFTDSAAEQRRFELPVLSREIIFTTRRRDDLITELSRG